MKSKSLLVSACGVAALALAVPGGLLGWREWRERTLLRELESPDPDARKAAAVELGRLKCTRAIAKLVRILEIEPPTQEENPLVDPPFHLADISDEYIPVLIGHGIFRIDVHWPARALRDIGAPAVPALADALSNSDNPWIRLQIIHVLHVLGPDAAAAVPALMRALPLEGYPVGFNASWALGKIGEGAMEALPTLEALALRYPGWPLLDQVIAEIARGPKRASP